MVTKDDQKSINSEPIKQNDNSKSKKDIKDLDMKPKVPTSVADVEGLEYIAE